MFEETTIKDLLIYTPKVFNDQRGYFFESYNQQVFKDHGLNYNWVQDNQSLSEFGTLRGLHFQTGAHSQSKLVRVITGKVWDVAVDLRTESETYGKHFGLELSENNQKQLLIPRGFAHGFLVLSATAIFAYKCDNFYHKDSEGGLKFDDPTLNIQWPLKIKDIKLSPKDNSLPYLK